MSNKVNVRIAVAVDPDGDWSASGGSAESDDFAMSLAIGSGKPREARYWLEAELDVPEVKTVVGKVVGA